MANSILIGEQSLLVQCAEVLLARGIDIDAVVTVDESIAQWCRKSGILQFTSIQRLESYLDANEQSFDYLFSITNLKILPATFIARAKKLAVNFHDGLLPRYAGLNVPVWVLLANEPTHGVTWHILEEGIDTGAILQQQDFPVAAEETSFTLNAKCYQAGLESFGSLVDDLVANNWAPQPQGDGERFYFGFKASPENGACLDFNQDADSLYRLARALDFGPYPNSVALPRLFLGDRVVVVRTLQPLQSPSGQAPGTLLSVTETSLTVATATAPVELSGVEDLAGQALDCATLLKSIGIELFSALPALQASDLQRLESQVSQSRSSEGFWINRLSTLVPLEAPYVDKNQGHASWIWREAALPEGLPSVAQDLPASSAYVALLALFLGRLGMKREYSLAVSLPQTDDGSLISKFVASVLPLHVAYEPATDFAQFAQSIDQGLGELSARQPYFKDLVARTPALKGRQMPEDLPVRVVLSAEDPQGADLAGAQLAVVVNPETGDVSIGSASITELALESLSANLSHLANELFAKPGLAIGLQSVLSSEEQAQITSWNQGECDVDPNQLLHSGFEIQASSQPGELAIVCEGQALSYAALNARANQLASYLREQGVEPGGRVGILLERSVDMVAAMLGTLKAGCAYVPLDPLYPPDRLNFMVEDSGLKAVYCQVGTEGLLEAGDYQKLVLEERGGQIAAQPKDNVALDIDSSSLAYVIYTSGSTGKPKGVMVEHRNAVNFFCGMDDRLEPGPGTWLAVTSISFDISVLEIFWTLSRGLKLLVYADERRQKSVSTLPASTVPDKDIDFGLFYWNVADDESQYDEDKYRLLLEGAKFADKNGFNSVWTPERHFAAFGGLFPNPALTSAALATITENVQLRAGSCVVPLHSPIRVAEDWSVVDNLSNGRVAIAVASGWAPPDFAIMPQNFSDAKNIMFETVETVQKLWRGDTVDFEGPNGVVPVRTLPRPIQPELPIWVTTAGNIDSFTRAAEIGANVLTHLLGQTVEEVEEKVRAYREAWNAAGHEGEGKVTLMLHTFVGPDEEQVEALVRQPMKNYLKSAMFLVKSAAWQFPAFKQMSEQQGKTLDEFFDTISDQDMNDLLEFAFQRYFTTSGLFGTPHSCLEMIDRVKLAGVNEIACLIDFGIDTDIVLEHLPYLAELLEGLKQAPTAGKAGDYSIPALMNDHDVTHFQCTPSMATMLVNDTQMHEGLGKLSQMMVGGEAFPPELAAELAGRVGGRVTNMYGPTETTIWSSTGEVSAEPVANVSIGKPLLNQQMHILDDQQQALPIGLAGELVIGGLSVVRGYHNREQLTGEVFLPDPSREQGRIYRTGDLARWLPDGTLECLGRVDHQVKIRGYRVELGEIESLLRAHSDVLEAAVILREDTPGDQRLVAYVSTMNDQGIDSDALAKHLSEKLPEFMVPGIFVEMPALPLTPNGKIDRKALPAPVRSAPKAEQSAAPAGEKESLVSGIWCRALGVDSVGMRENFFDIGGHSLLVIQVLKELREKVDKPIQMTDLFKYTTVESLAAFLGDDGTAQSAVVDQGQARGAARRASRRRRR